MDSIVRRAPTRLPGGADAAAIRRGHRALLATLREFAEELDGPGAGADAARGAAAFLRHTLLPFARREEAALVADGGAAESAALDHAFLAAEIGALEAESRALADDPGDPAAAAVVRRRVHRVEAVLELHLAREEESAPAPPAVPPSAPPGEPASGASGPREMEDGELSAFVAARRWGVLSVAGPDGLPYAVPVAYAWDGASFFVASGPGRKLRQLQAGGGACLTIPDVTDGARWRCAVARGPAAPVTGPAAKALALARIARRQGTAPSPADALRAARGHVFRIDPTELTGRARG